MGSMHQYICPICGNKDPRYFGIKNGEVYCRMCISFRGREVIEEELTESNYEAQIDYPLSVEQGRVSTRLLELYKGRKSALVHAVCGSGKTELVYAIISEAMKENKTVGFAVPRREVVVDLLPRFLHAYPSKRVIAVYGGHNQELTGDIILLTTHQLYRYKNYFDLLILDEIDAFPFKDNILLINFFHRSVKGSFVMMSATPPNDVISYFKNNNLEILELHTRYHRHPLPVPNIVIRIGFLKIFYLIKKIKEYKKNKKPLLIFAPTIYKAEELFSLLNIFIKKGTYVHSKCLNRNEIIKDFKNHKYDYLLTTSVLERGVTIKDVQVIIYDADDTLYNKGVLVQISGRVGRKIDAPTGEVIFLANKLTKDMKDAIDEINKDNTFLQR